MNPPVVLRLDDVGAASKRNEIYTDVSWGIGRLRFKANWIPGLKYRPGYAKWGPYGEMSGADWHKILQVLQASGARMTVAVTAAWVEDDASLTPFVEKFPDEAAALKGGVESGVIEIANHGLTHCVMADGAFRPRRFSSNRTYHREFWEWIPAETQREHIARSQDLLQGWLGADVVTLVPPGNVFSDATLAAAEAHGLQYMSCNTPGGQLGELWSVGTESVRAFHDRDIVLHGHEWLTALIDEQPESCRWLTVAELAAEQLTVSASP